jgi:hypothetical protein
MKEVDKSQLHDTMLQCLDCEKEFLFSAGEQQFYYSKGLATPKRCPRCRKIRRDNIVSDYRGGQDGIR